MRTLSKIGLVAVGCGACGNTLAPTPTPSLPWVRGFAPSASSDTETTAVSDRMADVVGTADDGYGGLQVTADVAPDEGSETVLASFGQGIAVLDRSGHVIAKRRGFDATGSGDDLVAIAAGDAGIGQPVIALAVQRGGHRLSEISIIVYRVGGEGQLDQLFEGAIEEHDGDAITTGALTFLPDTLLYRAPHATRATTWTFDPTVGRYEPG